MGLAELLQVLWACFLTEDVGRGVTRNQAKQGEDKNRDEEQVQRKACQPPGEICAHCPSSCVIGDCSGGSIAVEGLRNWTGGVLKASLRPSVPIRPPVATTPTHPPGASWCSTTRSRCCAPCC